jgi:hypothetical protein
MEPRRCDPTTTATFLIDGEYGWVMESGIPRYTGGEEFAGYIGSNIDITDRKRAEEERERLRQVQADLAG